MNKFNLRNHKKLLIGTLTIVSALVIIIISLKLFTDKANTGVQFIPVSYAEINEPISYNSSDTIERIKLTYTRTKVTDLENKFCTPVSYIANPSEVVDIDHLKYEIPEDSIVYKDFKIKNIYHSIFYKMRNYLHISKVKNSYESIRLLFNDQEIAPKVIDLGFYPNPCSGGHEVYLSFSKEIDMNTRLIISTGPLQSTVSSKYFPIIIKIIIRGTEDYEYISFSLQLEDILKTNDLSKCEILSEYNNYSYISIFESQAQECVNNVINTDVNSSKINILLDEVLNSIQ